MAQVQEVFLFNPTNIPTCSLWLDATDPNGNGTVPVNGSSVSTWSDKSGSGYNFTQADANRYPTINSTGMNNLPSVYFTGPATSANTTSKFLQNASIPITGPYTVFSIAKQDTSAPSLYGYNYILKGSVTNDACLLYGSGPSSFGAGDPGNFITSIGNGTNTWNDLTANTTLSTVKNTFLGCAIISGTSVTPFYNGTAQTVKTGASSAPSYTGMSIGEPQPNGFSGQNWNGLIGEIVIYTRALSTNERQQVEGYLAWKWGLSGSLPATHPYRTYRPLGAQPFPTVGIPPMPIPTQTTQAFVPTQVAGCQLWLDATDPYGTGILPTSGSAIAVWKDKSSNRYSGTPINSPTFQSGVQNGLPVIRFNGTNQYIDFGNVLNLGTSSLTVFVVTKFAINAGNQVGVVGKASYRANVGRWAINYDTVAAGPNGVGINFFIDDTNQALTGFVSNPNLQYNIICGINNRTTSNTLYLNGSFASRQTFSATANNISNTDPLYVASYPNGTGTGPQSGMFLNGDIAEIIVYLAALTDTQRQQVEGYLAWKWGLGPSLPIGQPYKQQPIVPFPVQVTPYRGGLNQWIPRQISGCQLWLDAADRNTLILSGSSVSQWNDKSGNGYTATGTVAPTYNSSTQYVVFNGTSQYCTVSTGAYPTGNNPYSIFTVAYTNNVASPQWILSGGTRSSNQAIGVLFYTTNAIWHSWWINEYALNNVVSNQVPVIINASYSSLRTTVVNGGTTLTNSPGATRNNASSPNYISSMPDPVGQQLNGGVGEIIIYNSEIPIVQRQQVEGYLAWKWGLVGSLPGNHPYKRWPPSP